MWSVLVSTAVVYSLLVVPTARANEIAGHIHLDSGTLDTAARRILRQENDLLTQACSRAVYASWNYQTNVTEHNRELAVEAQLQYASIKRHSWETIRRWRGLQEYLLSDDVNRQFQVMSVLGTTALPVRDLEEYKEVLSRMSSMYNEAKICSYKNANRCDLSLDKGIDNLLRRSRNPEELEYTWKAWRDNTGRNLRRQYRRFVRLANKAANYNGFENMAVMNFVPYEDFSFRDELADVWEQIKPLYEQLHAYARRKLRQVYGSEMIRERGPIPAHLLGNMWAQKWEVEDLLLPYPWREPIDITEEMVKQNYTPRKIFRIAEEFFTSLDLPKMPYSFWRKSLLEMPSDRKVVCGSSAWDFCNGHDFRIKQCTKVTMKGFLKAHHEMSHIQYFFHYKGLPYVFRGGANPGFHEALGGAIALSASTSKHFHRIGLLKYLFSNYAADVNDQMERAIDELAFLPFAYATDLWRWKVQDGSLEEKDWNCGWWDLRYELQGLKPPAVRTEYDFDPASKFNVVANYPYDKYFVGFIMQYQFYRALCKESGEYDPLIPNKPLHKCDFYGSHEAGALLKEMMETGASKPWREVLQAMTGERRLDGSALREYFKPLEEWLKTSNEKYNEYVGWKPDGEYCLYREPSPTRQSCNK